MKTSVDSYTTKTPSTIFARKTTPQLITLEEASEFVKTHHRQGMVSPGKLPIAVGLYYQEFLIAVAIISNPRTIAKKREYTKELLRLCIHKDFRVPGGASKLIKFYIREKNPRDLFTYQDSSGENTSVYELSGFSLRKNNRKKTVLVRNGLSFSEAKNNRRDWFSIEQVVNRGPDNLLGTEIGEIFNLDGTRKTNVELFTDFLDYHKEEIPGDREWEWNNPNVTTYCYKTTSTAPEDNNYYIGVRSIPVANAEIRDCLADSYIGSGGQKFQNWIKTVDKNELQKEILGVFPSLRHARSFEKKTIGDKFKTDPNCMNSLAGGGGQFKTFVTIYTRSCPIHGMTKFVGKSCARCTAKAARSVKNCDIHGDTVFIGVVCHRCALSTAYTYKTCAIHGLKMHKKNNCMTCVNNFNSEESTCGIHGLTAFQQGKCCRCSTGDLVSVKECSKHGLVKHRGESCITCVNQKSLVKKDCPVHGEANHSKNVCLRCVSDTTISVKKCKLHGETQHFGKTCGKCLSARTHSKQECPEHGLVTFKKDKCMSCSNKSAVTEKECPVHGLSKHRGSRCYKCARESRLNKI